MNVEQNLKSASYYLSIVGVNFMPKKVVKPLKKLAYKKGDIIPGKKHWFRKNEEEKRAETDLYDDSWADWEGYMHKRLITPAQYAQREFLCYNESTNEFYSRPMVKIEFANGNTKNLSFDSDAEALLFIDDLKAKCAKCNNELL